MIAAATSLLWWTVLLEPGRTFNLVVINALRAAGDARYPVYIGTWSMLIVMAGVRLDVLFSYQSNDMYTSVQTAVQGIAAGDDVVRDSGIRGFYMSLGVIFSLLATLHVARIMLDLFLVLIITLATARLVSRKAALLVLVTLAWDAPRARVLAAVRGRGVGAGGAAAAQGARAADRAAWRCAGREAVAALCAQLGDGRQRRGLPYS